LSNQEFKEKYNIKFLRQKFIHNSVYEHKNSWMLEVPYDIRDTFLVDVMHNYKTNFAKKGSFNLKFKTKKDLVYSMDVLAKHWNVSKKNKYYDLYDMKFESSTKRLHKLPATSRLIYHRLLDQWTLVVPRKVIRTNESQSNSIIALDPGVRTFLTSYDTEGNSFEFGKNDIGGLARLLHYRSKLQSKMKNNTTRSKKRRSYRKALLKLNQRMKNLVNDVHRKLIVFLVANYKEIHIPKLNFHKFRKMTKKTRAKSAAWNHCLFVDRLVDYCKSQNGPQKTNVVVCTEEYTSKTCSCCGNIKYDLGANKTYKCLQCKNIFDRDINAAKNILLKSLFC
jgi:transposase